MNGLWLGGAFSTQVYNALTSFRSDALITPAFNSARRTQPLVEDKQQRMLSDALESPGRQRDAHKERLRNVFNYSGFSYLAVHLYFLHDLFQKNSSLKYLKNQAHPVKL